MLPFFCEKTTERPELSVVLFIYYIYYNVRDSQLHQILGATAFCRIMSASVTVALPSPFMSARAS